MTNYFELFSLRGFTASIVCDRMDSTNGKRYHIMGFLETLTIVFIVLKLTEVIAWSWWMVFSPLWVGYAVVFILAIIIASVKVVRGDI